MSRTFSFPSVQGIQAKNKYYIVMVPLRFLSELFVGSNNCIISPEFRAQRVINETRIPEIKKYILENRDNYVFSALAASIDGEFKFVPICDNCNLGYLEFSSDAVFFINDGQHRKKAIEEAIEICPELQDESISIVLYQDKGLLRSQQIFSDLNKHANKTSNSLSTLYDSRDPMAVITKELVDEIKFLNKFTDCERDILGSNSSKLLTLSTLYKANNRIMKITVYNTEQKTFLLNFWSLVLDNIFELNELMDNKITKKSFRENYIITLSMVFQAFGKLGRFYYKSNEVNMENSLQKLQCIDWSRSNKKDWMGRVFKSNERISNDEKAITLTYFKIKSLLGLTLTNEEKIKERSYMR